MKKMVKNQKGFSLIELLIVIAIMGVLAIIAFNAFSGVVNNVKKRADDQNAKLIEKALTAYIIDSGDTGLTNLHYSENGTNYKTFVPAATQESVRTLITALMCSIHDKQSATNYKNDYGPYLSPEDGKSPSLDTQFDLQWGTPSGGEYIGYRIEIYKKNRTVTVQAVNSSSSPGIYFHP